MKDIVLACCITAILAVLITCAILQPIIWPVGFDAGVEYCKAEITDELQELNISLTKLNSILNMDYTFEVPF